MAEGNCENYICKCHNKNVEKKYLKNSSFPLENLTLNQSLHGGDAL